MRHLLDKHILIVTALVTILGSFGGTLGVMPFFGKANAVPLMTQPQPAMRYAVPHFGRSVNIS